MSKPFYCITDFDVIDFYFDNKKSAISFLKELIDECLDGNWDTGLVSFRQFELPKIPHRKLVINLLEGHEFMTNIVKIDINQFR